MQHNHLQAAAVMLVVCQLVLLCYSPEVLQTVGEKAACATIYPHLCVLVGKVSGS